MMSSRWPRRLPAVLCVGLLLLGCWVSSLGAGDPADAAANQDLRHTILARTVLLRDRDLGPLNLGVRVQNRVVVLWGPVPSVDLMFRAVAVLQKVPDFLEVRNQLHVETLEETRPSLLPESVPPGLAPPMALPGFSRGEESWRGAFVPRPLEGRAVVSPAEDFRLRLAAARVPRADRNGSESLVLPAIRLPGPAPAAAAVPLEEAVRRLRQRDARFQGIQAEVRAGQVYLSGSVAHWQDAYELAAAITHLAGVERVVLDQIQTQAGQ
jgi:osmotically-inducible protein OsmY